MKFLILARRSGLSATELKIIAGLDDTHKSSTCSLDDSDEVDLLVLPDVVLLSSLLINPGKALEAGVRHVFLILAPADSFVLQQINHGRDVGRNSMEGVIVHAEVVPADCSDVVGLAVRQHISHDLGRTVTIEGCSRWMSNSEILGKGNALLGKPCQICYKKVSLVE